MNKKVLTLCAGLLLAGGAFSFVNASEWYQDTQYVLNTGKYHLIHQVANNSSGSWAAATTAQAEYYLSADENGTPKFSKIKDENAYWTITTEQEAGVTYYKFTNAKGNVLTYVHDAGGPNEETITSFSLSQATTPVTLNDIYYTIGGTNYFLASGTRIDSDNVGVEFSSTVNDARGFDNVEIAEEIINAADLNAQDKNGFQLNFKNYDSLEGNVFSGTLRAIPASVGGSHAQTYYLYKPETDEYIVLTENVWSKNTANLDGKPRSAYQGYKFDTVSSHAWSGVQNKKQVAEFQILKSYDFNKTDSLIVTMPYALVGEMPDTNNDGEADWTGESQYGNWNEDKGVRVFVSTVNDINYVTVIEYAKANDRLAVQQDDSYATPVDVNGDSTPDEYEVGASAPYIVFGEGNNSQINIENTFAGKVWNILTPDGSMIMSPEVTADIDEYEGLFAPAKQVDLTNPEGHWLLNKNAEGYYFVNRESGAKFFVSETGNEGWIMRKTATADLYEICWKHQMITGKWQSIVIKEAKNAELGNTEKGYKVFDMNKEANNGQYLSFETSLGVTAYIGKDADDNVILTQDASKAIEFRVKQLTHDFEDHDGVAAPDTLQHYTTFLNKNAKGEVVTDVDTLQFFQYALYENFSEKYLHYDRTDKKFVLTAWDAVNNGHEDFDLDGNGSDYAFVVKEKEDGSYVLVRDYAIDYDYCTTYGAHHTIGTSWTGNRDYAFDNIFETNFGDNAYLKDANGKDVTRTGSANGNAHKAYAATQPGTLADMAGIYNYTDNDRITMESTNKVEYMKFEADFDTIKVSLEAKPNFFLYEHNENGTNFLGMEHVADADMKAAIFVDTAYVRNDTYRPQYLLAVGANHVDEVWDNHGSKDPVHLLHADTTYGRFLVNMVDSAAAWTGSVKTNPYIHEELNGNYYYRLAFIDGIHTDDALILNTTGTKTKINLNNNDDKVCTFAFRYVDEDREGVKIETTYDGKTRGWLKYQNNVPVVTNDYEDAHVFLIDNTTTEAPTANESINANEAVSVTATEGAVIIKGAEGKNVVIATILGKVVANETVNSDNETIAVPAGIAVVSVDGESFKVVVK